MITGLANSGKTLIYNSLTGGYGVVANYPMTTVELNIRSVSFRGRDLKVIDTPGTNTLHADSSDALVFRRALIEHSPDCILQCIDANRLKQSLGLTAELIDLGIPLVLSLNAIDETVKKGLDIDVDMLSRLLGVPVLQTNATQQVGMYDLKEALVSDLLLPRANIFSDEVTTLLERMLEEIPEEVPYRRSIASLTLCGDHQLLEREKGKNAEVFALSEKTLERLAARRVELLKTFRGDMRIRIERQVSSWVDEIYERVARRTSRVKHGEGILDSLAYYSRHPVYGLFFLLIFLAISYVGVVLIAGELAGLLESLITEPAVSWIDSMVSSELLRSFLIGDFGILTLGLFNAICTILPILSVFFFLFGILEDVGYLPNLSVLLRRAFTKVGLSGRAVLPIVLGFGCKTMATLTTRTLSSRKERLISIYLIAFAIPCSAQLALNIAILGRAGVVPFIIAVLFLVIVEVLAGKILNRVIKSDAPTFFVQELPPFRAPSTRAVFKKTYYRLLWFLKEAIPVFMLAAAVIFTLDTIGLLDLLKGFLEPVVVRWMGLPIEMVEALILLIAREEAAAGLILRLSDLGKLTAVQSIIAVVVTTMFVPCFANIVAMFKEAGAKAGILMLLGINISTVLLAGILNWVLLTGLSMIG